MFRVLNRTAVGQSARALGGSRNQVLARDLAGAAPTIDEGWMGGAVLDLCASHPTIPSFAVVEGQGRVIGLIERERLYFQFSQPLWFDVYNRRPIAPLVTRDAMVVDGATPIENVKELIAFRYPQAISSGFAIVEQGLYSGIGTMTALLEKTVDLTHRRAAELEEARLRLARDLRLAVRLLQLDRAPVGEVDRLLQQRGHGADAEIAFLLHDREAAGDRLRVAEGDQLFHAFDRHGACAIGRRLWTSNQSRCENWE